MPPHPCENGGTGNTRACSLDGSVNDECSDVVAATHLPNPPSPSHDPETVFSDPVRKRSGTEDAEDLPKGAFMCEFVGEILTIVELHKRNSRKSSGKHSYVVLLRCRSGFSNS
ncbi:hypothetical protein Dimus_018662 [Dionaea muscipula]